MSAPNSKHDPWTLVKDAVPEIVDREDPNEMYSRRVLALNNDHVMVGARFCMLDGKPCWKDDHGEWSDGTDTVHFVAWTEAPEWPEWYRAGMK